MNTVTGILVPLIGGLGGVYFLRKHWWAKRMIHKPVQTSSLGPLGVQVAEQVAKRLEQGDVLAYSHRDYCGVGLRYGDGEYIYGEVTDGELPSTTELRRWLSVPENMERRTFGSRGDFVAWLAEQTDESLYGENLRPEWLIGNQRLTIRRLVDFANGKPEAAT